MTLEAIHALIKNDLERVNQSILSNFKSPVGMIDEISQHLINSGGKRIRAILCLLCARACNHLSERHVTSAAIIEFIHGATLLHDDVVDGSLKRRGKPAAHIIWGEGASILVGDYLYSRSFQMMVELESLTIMGIIADTTNTIAQAEVRQLFNKKRSDLSESEYREIIMAKTASLFEASAKLGAIHTNDCDQQAQALGKFGLHLGMAFQLVDDLLDYTAKSSDLGKNLGDDLAEGKATLPLIYTMKHGSPAQKTLIKDALSNGKADNLADVQAAIIDSGAINYTLSAANEEKRLAIESIDSVPDSPYKQALIELVNFSVERQS